MRIARRGGLPMDLADIILAREDLRQAHAF
jgi:hypothetical protein